MKPIIEMKEIEKHFGSVIALAGVTIDFYPGECHCLLGDNGAGKSTFIKTRKSIDMRFFAVIKSIRHVSSICILFRP